MSKRVMLMFGEFSPIHKGHLKIAKELKEHYKQDYFRFIPYGNVPTDGQKLKKLNFSDRTKILREVLSEELKEEIYYDPILENVGFSMFQTAKFFRGLGFDVSIAMGEDCFEKLEHWRDSKKLIEEFPIAVFGEQQNYETNGEADYFKTKLLNVSSEKARAAILNNADLTAIIPEPGIKLVKSMKQKFELIYKN